MTNLVNLETETRTILLKQTIADGDDNHAPSCDAVHDYVNTMVTNIDVIKVVSDKGTASANTMNKLYIEVGPTKTDVFYTVKDGSTYSWESMDEDILDNLSIGWADIQNKPETFTPSAHAHGNLQNDGVVKKNGTAQTGKNVVTDGSGNLTTEDKPTIPDVSGKEDKSNKSSSITSDTGSTTKYPTVNAVENYIGSIIGSIEEDMLS